MRQPFRGLLIAALAVGLGYLVLLALRKTSDEDVARRLSKNNLKQIALAIEGFTDGYKHRPPAAILSKDGEPLLSWRVAILPYMEEAILYRQFKLDEPWDSLHNIELLGRIPRIYRSLTGEEKETPATFYRAFVGPGTAWETTPAPGSEFGAWGLERNRPVPRETVLVVEAGKAVPWTKPDELVYDANKPLPKLGGLFEAGFHLVRVDGQVEFVERANAAIIREMIERAKVAPAKKPKGE